MVQNTWSPYSREILAMQETSKKPKRKKVRGQTKTPRSYPERDLVHRPLVAWFNKTYPLWKDRLFHFASERKCTPQQGAMLKMLGCKAGVSDLFIAIPNGTYSSLWLELKAPGGKPTESQYEFLSLMKRMGFEATWSDSFHDAQNIIQIYLSPCLEWTVSK